MAALHSFVTRLAAIALFALIVPVTPSLAQASGYVRLKIVKAGLLVGGGVGSGVLTYRGRDYPFRLSGISLGITAGATIGQLEGWASGIRDVRDFAGAYSSVGAGGSFVGGFGGVQLSNARGVRIALQGLRAGMEFAGNLGQITISLRK
jgi:lipid-binding SYLF domain-containing protein